MRDNVSAVDRMAALGARGFTVSVCCGPCGGAAFRWSVDVLTTDWRTFDRPFAANSFDQCIDIAEQEILKRGW